MLFSSPRPSYKPKPPPPERDWLIQRGWVSKRYERRSYRLFICPVSGDIYDLEDAVKAQIAREVTND